MSELSARAQVLLQQARTQATPSDEELALNRSRLRLKLHATPRFAAWKSLATMVVVGLLAALPAGLTASRLEWPAPPVAPPVVVQTGQPRPLDDQVLAAVEPSLTCRGIETHTSDGVEQRPARVMKGLPRCDPGPPGQRPLAGRGLAEPPSAIDSKRDGLGLEILEEARLALDEKRPFDALGQVQKHQQLYPVSQFQEERLALQVIALCLAERPELAAPRLAEFTSEYAASTYAPRIERACADLRTGSPK